MKNEQENAPVCYFAAANGFSGFRSYFAEIFDPYDYSKIFIIKGGPGTGKSTLMKKLSAKFNTMYSTEEVLCSSDPASLDGVIFKHASNKIAIIDGTAPHAIDPHLPGAVEEIINLGDNWNSSWLEARKDEISELCKEKRLAYKTAYNALSIAGTADNAISNQSHHKSIQIAKPEAYRLAEKVIGGVPKEQIRLISAFGRRGIFKLKNLQNIAERTIGILGEDLNAQEFLNCLYEACQGRADLIRFPDVFDKNKTEALFFPVSKIAVFIGEGDENITLDNCFSPLERERTKEFIKLRNDALEDAARWFNVASDLHFRLEEIYSEAMDYSKNDIVFNELSEKISNVIER